MSEQEIPPYQIPDYLAKWVGNDPVHEIVSEKATMKYYCEDGQILDDSGYQSGGLIVVQLPNQTPGGYFYCRYPETAVSWMLTHKLVDNHDICFYHADDPYDFSLLGDDGISGKAYIVLSHLHDGISLMLWHDHLREAHLTSEQAKFISEWVGYQYA